ncbi:MAG: hypothetical protein LBN27_11235 [Prevotellaceae bacterium]|jgi:hypothetical protein|nr:hypothetical protein [Prevotellaceae bacterium]
MKKIISFYVMLTAFVPFAYATTYDGSFSAITEGTANFLANMPVTLTDNGNSYSIDLGGFDNVQMDAEGNLSRDGYVSADGSNYFLLSGYVKNDSLVFRFGLAIVLFNPELILYTYEFRGKVRVVPTIAEMEEQGLVQSVSNHTYQVSGNFGDESSYDIEIFPETHYYSYICKYTLSNGDFLDIINNSGEDCILKVLNEQGVVQTTNVYNTNSRELFIAENDGIFYVQIYKISEEVANYDLKIQWYGKIQEFIFNNQDVLNNIEDLMTEENIKSELGYLSVIGTDCYEQDINFYSTISSQWTIDIENKTASFVPIFIPFVDFEFPLAEGINNTVSWGETAPTDLTQTSAEKTILKEEYFGIDGKRAKDISPLRIKRTIYTDGTVKVEKELR